MLTFIVIAALAALSTAYELDFGPLKIAGGLYEYTIVLSFKGEPDVKFPIGIAAKFGPKRAADQFMKNNMDDSRWVFKQDGERVIVWGYDDVPVTKVTVEGNGLRPLIRHVPFIPPQPRRSR